MSVVPMKLAKNPIVGAAIPEAYSTLLLDAMRGDATVAQSLMRRLPRRFQYTNRQAQV